MRYSWTANEEREIGDELNYSNDISHIKHKCEKKVK